MFVSIHKSAFCDEKKQQYQQLCLDGIFKAITTFHICHCDVRARVCAFICFNSKQLIILFHSKVWPSQFLLWQRRSHDNEQRNTPDAHRYATLECVCVCLCTRAMFYWFEQTWSEQQSVHDWLFTPCKYNYQSQINTDKESISYAKSIVYLIKLWTLAFCFARLKSQLRFAKLRNNFCQQGLPKKPQNFTKNRWVSFF